MASYAENSKARFDYEILEKLTGGLELLGAEVKSIRQGKISLAGSYVVIRGQEAFLTGADVAPYQPKNTPRDYDRTRPRKILLSKKEIQSLEKAENTKGLTIIPLSVYNKGRFIKLDIAIARGKKKFDKRQAIKKRDTERDLKRTLKS